MMKCVQCNPPKYSSNGEGCVTNLQRYAIGQILDDCESPAFDDSSSGEFSVCNRFSFSVQDGKVTSLFVSSNIQCSHKIYITS